MDIFTGSVHVFEVLCYLQRYGVSVDDTVDELQRILANLNGLVVVSKDMRAVKLCANKILQFLTGGAG